MHAAPSRATAQNTCLMRTAVNPSPSAALLHVLLSAQLPPLPSLPCPNVACAGQHRWAARLLFTCLRQAANAKSKRASGSARDRIRPWLFALPRGGYALVSGPCQACRDCPYRRASRLRARLSTRQLAREPIHSEHIAIRRASGCSACPARLAGRCRRPQPGLRRPPRIAFRRRVPRNGAPLSGRGLFP